eukprot:scaffold130853_cov20-Tisochrysis_lutea.AAC.2
MQQCRYEYADVDRHLGDVLGCSDDHHMPWANCVVYSIRNTAARAKKAEDSSMNNSIKVKTQSTQHFSESGMVVMNELLFENKNGCIPGKHIQC